MNVWIKNSAAILIFAVAAFGQGATTNPGFQLAKEIVKSNKGRERLIANVKSVLPYLKRRYPRVPSRTWKAIEIELTRDEFFDRVANVYAKNFTDDELHSILSFVKTDVGAKIFFESFDPKTISDTDRHLVLTFMESKQGQKFLAKDGQFNTEMAAAIKEWQSSAVLKVREREMAASTKKKGAR
ncbi:MAG TPA: DUF2059 domain-containing protein [Holophagaceae bacterium]|nr:DUF2059 domain-containing protein [Holophagaceae bacterium]